MKLDMRLGLCLCYCVTMKCGGDLGIILVTMVHSVFVTYTDILFA